MSGEPTRSTQLTRRNALRKTAGSLTLAGLASSGASAATVSGPGYSDAAFEAAKGYLSEDAVRTALETHGSDALNEAVAEGALDTADPGALPVDTLHDTPTAWVESTEGATVVTGERDGQPNPKVEVKKRLDDGRTFKLAVHPEQGESQWTVEGGGTTRDASTSVCGCWRDVGCAYVCVGGTCEARWLYCCCDYTCDSGDLCDNPTGCSCQDICGSTC